MATVKKRERKALPLVRRRSVAPARGGGERFELAMRAINEGVYDWDVASGAIYYSEAVYSVLHMPRSVKTPAGWRKRIHPDDLAAYDAALVAHFRKKTRRFECDYRYQARDRTWRWARQHGIAQRDARGRVVRMIGSTGDITELKRVELALAESRERYALATWAATEGIYEWNLVTGMLFLSDRAKAFFGVKGAKLTPAAWNARIHRDDFPGYRSALAAYFKGRTRQFVHEYRIRDTKGGYAWVVDRAAAVRDASKKVVRLVGALADVTQRKLAEIELRRARDEANEALERQTATAEILKVIASSPSDVQPVFDAIVASAIRLIGGRSAVVTRLVQDELHLVAFKSMGKAQDASLKTAYPLAIAEAPSIAEAIRIGKPRFVADVDTSLFVVPRIRESMRRRGLRSMIHAPMIHNGAVFGLIHVSRAEPGPFADHHIALLKTFADQAVIAIQNARLFNETREALERQTATAEILKVIASSPSDVQPVLDAIAASALRLLGGRSSAVTQVVGDMVHLSAHTATDQAGSEALKGFYPRPISSTSGLAAVVRSGKPAYRNDTESDPNTSREAKELARTRGYRSLLWVPMLRDGVAFGTINVSRSEPGPFADHQINLLTTFADQAVIAIENVRLFNETKEALERQTATAEILRVIGGSMTDTQPVFDAIVKNGGSLFKESRVSLWLIEGDQLHTRASSGESAGSMPIDRGSAVGACVLGGRLINLPDLEAAVEEYPRIRQLGLKFGYRSGIYAPLMREGRAIGAISVLRREAGAIDEKEVALLNTFADQAVIAIENVRLFNELESRNNDLAETLKQQTATSEILKVMSSSPTDTQPVLDAITENLERLVGPCLAGINMLEGNLIHLRSMAHSTAAQADLDALARIYPIPFDPTGESSSVSRAIVRRQTVEVLDTEVVGMTPVVTSVGRALRFRSITQIPLMREGEAIGTFAIGWPDPGVKLSEKQLALAKTFADQAVIAIENVRLFNETKEALERQTATAEILKVIAGSPSDVQPVFDTIVKSALSLCKGLYANVFRYDGELLHFMATESLAPRGVELMRAKYPMRPDASQASGRGISAGAVVRIDDVSRDPDYDPRLVVTGGPRRMLAVPMMREGAPIGVVVVAWGEPGPIVKHHEELLQTFADQAVIAIENVRLFNETKEALERQTATAEILKVIASSPEDVAPVFDAIAERARILCGALVGATTRYDGELLHLVGYHGGSPEAETLMRGAFPLKPGPGSINGRCILARAPVQIPDVRLEVGYDLIATAQAANYLSLLAVPMLLDGQPIGVIGVTRREAGAFPDKIVELLQTFADQAVIAIQNVRLFNETKEALERQTATAEILKVISSSPTDEQPVFDAIVASADRLFTGRRASLRILDGDRLVRRAGRLLPDEQARFKVLPVDRDSIVGQAVLDCRVTEVADTQGADASLFAQRNLGNLSYRSMCAAPLLRDGKGIGVISVTSLEPGAMPENQKQLLQTFADQAVIAIENVRLFKELEARNRDVTDALERQTATAEILKVIASSPSDVQPVFDAIVKSCLSLFDGMNVALFLARGDQVDRVAFRLAADANDEAKDLFPLPLSDASVAGGVILSGRAANIADALNDSGVGEHSRRVAERMGYRSLLAVPLLRDGKAIGSINVFRKKAERFSDQQISLLKTFADQAVIAIENVRLFNETKEALERQTATAEILKVISSSPTDTQPVFDAILEGATRLCDAHIGVLNLFDGEHFRTVAQRGGNPQFAKWVFERGPFKGSTGGLLRLRQERQPFQVADVKEGEEYRKGAELAIKFVELGGARSLLMVPLVKESQLLGNLAIYRPEVRPFSQKQVDLVGTFADQAVIAIENVRLFKELQWRTDALTKSVGQLTALGEVGQAISSTLDIDKVLETVVTNAMRLTELDAGVIYEYDAVADHFELLASKNFGDVAGLRGSALRAGEGAVGGSVAAREAKQVPDTHALDYPARLRELLDREGFRAVLAVPLVREEQVIGALMMLRKAPGEFAPDVLGMLKTFAAQSAMAIQNARLFREIAEKGKQLELASQHKSNFLASMSHELRTPLNAILGFNEMILGQVYGEVPADMQEPLADIQTSGKHLLRLINNVLDLAKIEAGRMELSLQDYSVHDTVATVHSTLRPLAAEKGLEFLANVPNDVPLAYGDGGRLAQCLMNLAGNSIKFTKAGKVEISVAEKDGLLTYRVSDTGIGIPPDKIDSLFTEFKQTDATIASEYGGTGLGLSISKKFVEMHGGRIWIESELGKGSSFIIEVPLRIQTP